MTDIMKLADDHAAAQGDARADLGANAGMDEQDPMWIAMKEARAALQSAIEALQAENERLKSELDKAQEEINCAESSLEAFSCEFEAEVFNQGFECLGDFVQALWTASNGQRNALQTQEPVDENFGVVMGFNEDGYALVDYPCEGNTIDLEEGMALYAAPKALAPLTNAQVLDGCKSVGIADSIGFIEAFELGVKYSERHHGIGGTP